jgi:hypothetical protein
MAQNHDRPRRGQEGVPLLRPKSLDRPKRKYAALYNIFPEEGTAIERNDKTTKLLGLFTAALLAVTAAGCGTADQARSGHVHVDRNNDGYCDEDGEPMPARSGGGHYYGVPFFGGSTRTGVAAPGQPAGSSRPAGITGGSAPRGGIGSSHTGGGG